MGEIQFLDVVYAGPVTRNRKSKIGLRHAIKLQVRGKLRSWSGHNIQNIGPTIANQVLVSRTLADLCYTYSHIITLRTRFTKPAQNERCFYGQNEHEIKTNILVLNSKYI